MYPELHAAASCSRCPAMNTRPTTDRVKENVFNLIQDHVRGAEVLDLFAGTGQLGIEALSRGAAHCDFVEHNKAAYGIVSKNVESARVKDKGGASTARRAAEFVSKAGRERYDVILPRSSVRRRDLRKCAETDRNV